MNENNMINGIIKSDNKNEISGNLISKQQINEHNCKLEDYIKKIDNYITYIYIKFKRLTSKYEMNKSLYQFIISSILCLSNYDKAKRMFSIDISYLLNVHEYNILNKCKVNINIPKLMKENIANELSITGNNFNELFYGIENNQNSDMILEQTEEEKLIEKKLQDLNIEKDGKMEEENEFCYKKIDNKKEINDNNNKYIVSKKPVLYRNRINFKKVSIWGRKDEKCNELRYFEKNFNYEINNFYDINLICSINENDYIGIISKYYICSVTHRLNPYVIKSEEKIEELKEITNETIHLIIDNEMTISSIKSENKYSSIDIVKKPLNKEIIKNLINQTPSTNYISIGNIHYDIITYCSIKKYNLVRMTSDKDWLSDSDIEIYRKYLDQYFKQKMIYICPVEIFHFINKQKFSIPIYRALCNHMFNKLFIICHVNDNHWILLFIKHEIKENTMKEEVEITQKILDLYGLIENEQETKKSTLEIGDNNEVIEEELDSKFSYQKQFSFDEKKSYLKQIRMKYRNDIKTTVYVYDSLKNEMCDTDQPIPYSLRSTVGFERLKDLFNLDDSSLIRVKIKNQPNHVDCGYRCLFNIYKLGFGQDENITKDPYDETEFTIFTELICSFTKRAHPRMTIDELHEYINKLD